MQAHPFVIKHYNGYPLRFAERTEDFFHQAGGFLLVDDGIGQIFCAVVLKCYISVFFFRQGREDDRFCFAQEIYGQIMGYALDPGLEFIRVLQLIEMAKAFDIRILYQVQHRVFR